MNDIVSKVIDWTNKNCLKDKPDFVVTEDTPLLENNLMDSMDFLSLVTFLEEEHNIKIDTDDMTPDNFETPRAVAALVAKRHPAA